MRFTEILFAKELKDISVEDVKAFFAEPREESNKMEFKSYETGANDRKDPKDREKDILRTICGMLNSEGGIILWGAPSNLSSSGTLTPLSKLYKKDDFMAKIANLIIPSPQGIVMLTVPIDNGYVYLFDIPRSDYSPHQFLDKYYMRLDGQTKAAPHHYIEAQFKKITFPNLEAYLKLEQYGFVNDSISELSCSIIFRNQSPFQNDYELHYRLFTSHGTPEVYYKNASLVAQEYDLSRPGDYTKPNVANTIYYGNWIDDRFKIVFSRDALYKHQYHVDVRLQFGARHSPMKLNLYKLHIGEKMKDNIQDHIIEMAENRFFNIYEEDMGTPDQERLRKTLGR